MTTQAATHATTDHPKRAVLYRMVMEKHTCPYGLKAKYLLEREGFQVEDYPLRSREETDAFKERVHVKTTPQVFIEGQRIGGYSALREHLGKSVRKEGETTYTPVLAVFAMAALMSLAFGWVVYGAQLGAGLANWGMAAQVVEWFVASSMCILALLKLRDLRSFSTMFLNYDVLAQRWVPYSFLYPFAEAAAGVLMLAGALTFLSAPVALFIGTIGAWSVIKAVYIQKRELKCACVGGDTDVPLGFVSLTENLAMIAMGIWMLVKLAL